MARSSKKLTALFIIAAAGVAVLILRAVNPSLFDRGDVDLRRAKGSPDAQIKIVEYIDFQCPACAYGSKILAASIKEHPEKIFLEMNYFPLQSIHRHAELSSYYAECAARQDKFWPMHDLLIERQQQWKGLISAKPAFQQMAKEIGLNMNQLESCLGREDIRQNVADLKAAGEARGVKSTPTYFVNGEMVVGAKSLAETLNGRLSL